MPTDVRYAREVRWIVGSPLITTAPAFGVNQARQDPEQRGLPGAVGTKERMHGSVAKAAGMRSGAPASRGIAGRCFVHRRRLSPRRRLDPRSVRSRSSASSPCISPGSSASTLADESVDGREVSRPHQIPHLEVPRRPDAFPRARSRLPPPAQACPLAIAGGPGSLSAPSSNR